MRHSGLAWWLRHLYYQPRTPKQLRYTDSGPPVRRFLITAALAGHPVYKVAHTHQPNRAPQPLPISRPQPALIATTTYYYSPSTLLSHPHNSSFPTPTQFLRVSCSTHEPSETAGLSLDQPAPTIVVPAIPTGHCHSVPLIVTSLPQGRSSPLPGP